MSSLPMERFISAKGNDKIRQSQRGRAYTNVAMQNVACTSQHVPVFALKLQNLGLEFLHSLENGPEFKHSCL